MVFDAAFEPWRLFADITPLSHSLLGLWNLVPPSGNSLSHSPLLLPDLHPRTAFLLTSLL